MFLGIPYHAAQLYAPLLNWYVPSPDSSPFLGIVSEALHIFRMPIFVCVPLVSAMLLLNPVVMTAISLGPGGGQDELVRKLTTVGDHWMWHLWFLPVLIGMCAVLALMEASGVLRAVSSLTGQLMKRPRWAALLIWSLGGG